jgi:uncharacterized membrane protein YiaA
MKKLGLALLVIGLLITLFSGFQFITRKKVVDIGDVHITQKQTHTADWSPLIGIGVMAVGGVFLTIGSKKK